MSKFFQAPPPRRMKKIALVGCGLLLSVCFFYGWQLFIDWYESQPPIVSAKSPAWLSTTPHPVFYEIPRLEHVEIDGFKDDWGQPGFQFASLCPTRFSLKDGTLEASAQIAWSPEGLLVYAEVKEPVYARQSDPKLLNASELVMSLGTAPAGEEEESKQKEVHYSITIRRAGGPGEKVLTFDLRPLEDQKKISLETLIKTRKTAEGYSLEALLPFQPLELKNLTNSLISFNLDTSVSDGKKSESRQFWRPMSKGDLQPLLKLSDTASFPIKGYAYCDLGFKPLKTSYQKMVVAAMAKGKKLKDLMDEGLTAEKLQRESNARKICMLVLAKNPKLSGSQVVVKDEDEKIVGQAPYKANTNIEVIFPQPQDGVLYKYLTVYVDSTPITRVVPFKQKEKEAEVPADRPDRLYFDSYVFSGSEFPSPQLADPIATKQSMGAYRMETTFYNASMKPVSIPEKNGRYGAITTVHTSSNTLFRMYSTLLKDDTIAQSLPKREGASIPRVSDNEVVAIEQLALRESKPEERNKVVDKKDKHYFAFDHNQKWWLALRDKLNIRFPMLVNLPPSYSANSSKKWPVIISCHGGGAQDVEDLNNNLLEEDFTKVVQGGEGPFTGPDGKGKGVPFIVLQPELSVGDLRWTPTIMRAVIHQAAKEYRIDEDRVILTGTCGGASGAFRIIVADPSPFAAFVPLTIGHMNYPLAARLKNVPTWLFTGGADTNPIPVHSTAVAEVINKAGGHAKVSVLPGVGHDTQSVVWKRQDVWNWMLKQHRHIPKQAIEPIEYTRLKKKLL